MRLLQDFYNLCSLGKISSSTIFLHTYSGSTWPWNFWFHLIREHLRKVITYKMLSGFFYAGLILNLTNFRSGKSFLTFWKWGKTWITPCLFFISNKLVNSLWWVMFIFLLKTANLTVNVKDLTSECFLVLQSEANTCKYLLVIHYL